MARITKIQNEKWFSLTWKLQEKIECKGRCLRKQWSNVCPSVLVKTNLKYNERLLVTKDILVWLGTLSKPHGFIACSVQKTRHKHRLQSTECIFLHRLVKLKYFQWFVLLPCQSTSSKEFFWEKLWEQICQMRKLSKEWYHGALIIRAMSTFQSRCPLWYALHFWLPNYPNDVSLSCTKLPSLPQSCASRMWEFRLQSALLHFLDSLIIYICCRYNSKP